MSAELDTAAAEARLLAALLAAADELTPAGAPWRPTLRAMLLHELDARLHALAEGAGEWAPGEVEAALLRWRWTCPVWRCALPEDRRPDPAELRAARLSARAALEEWSADHHEELTAAWAEWVDAAQGEDAAWSRVVGEYLSALRRWKVDVESYGQTAGPRPAEPIRARHYGGGAFLLGVAPHLALPSAEPLCLVRR